MFYIGLKREDKTSYKYDKNLDSGAQIGLLGGHMFRRGPSRENMKKPSCLKPQGLRP